MKTLQLSMVTFALLGSLTLGLADDVTTTTDVATTTEVVSDTTVSDVATDTTASSDTTVADSTISSTLQDQLSALQDATPEERVALINELKQTLASLSSEEVSSIMSELRVKIKGGKSGGEMQGERHMYRMQHKHREMNGFTGTSDVASTTQDSTVAGTDTPVAASSAQGSQTAQMAQMAQMGQMNQMQSMGSSSNVQQMMPMMGRGGHH